MDLWTVFVAVIILNLKHPLLRNPHSTCVQEALNQFCIFKQEFLQNLLF